ncbi:MAG: YggS family pyridoxal phosphate-dependent enzyme [Dehalococcoidia bacterium]|nr:YggS family pyridoxal phosphate-dependent enzyme [Dehalococcoidia bacterium]
MEAAASRSGRDVEKIRLIAVSKNFSAAAIHAAYCCGLKDFGENRVQEAQSKTLEIADIRNGLTLHLIGHLQTNKVRDTLKVFDIIHSVDSIHLANEISKRATGKVPVLIEVNVAKEVTKYGLSAGDLIKTVDAIGKLPDLEISGLMTVAPYVEDPEEVRPVFRELKNLNDCLGFKQLSMGMTDDFEVAIEEGATMIRVGRAIFGERRY